MTLPLSASVNVTFGGDRFLHAWLQHSFSGSGSLGLSLSARARQFSSFVILVGQVTSPTTFEPKCAAIVRNRDELTIPLEASTIPTPKEFKDAIASLSPEMQGFAKAFRAMQLESTLFGVVLIQIKPQLEKVLNLQEDDLTKEIKLTQELMRLFIEYQIPSDLLRFDGTTGSDEDFEISQPTTAERLDAVKSHVKSIYEIIEHSKAEELHERTMEARFEAPLQQRSLSPVMMDACMEMSSAGRAEVYCAGPAPTARSRRAFHAFAPPPLQQQQQQRQAHPQPQTQSSAQPSSGVGAVAVQRDYTQVPKELDARFERLDQDNCLRPTIIKPGDVWSKREKKKLLADFTSRTLHGDDQKKEKNATFDLLDALTKSGGLPVEQASLHIFVAATHQFDKSVTETVVQDNVNPVDKVERSMLIMASTVHQVPTAKLLQAGQRARVEDTSPQLFQLEDIS